MAGASASSVVLGARRPRVVIIGAGFGGLAAARRLRGAAVDVVLVDQRNHHLFQPLLYQVASALLDPSEIAYPVRASVRRGGNVDVRLGQVVGIDLGARRVHTDLGDLDYDQLIVAAGAVTNYFGNRSVEERAFGLKSLGEALALRNHLLANFERAAWTDDAGERRRLMTIAIVGAGPTGVELAGAFSELVHLVLRKDYPRLDLAAVRIVLLEGTDTVLAAFRPRLRDAALRTLARKRVEVRLNAMVRESTEGGIVLATGERVACATVVWTAGVRGAEVGAMLGAPLTRQGRVAVEADLRLPGHPEVYVIGDLAVAMQKGRELPMLGAVAVQQGHYVAGAITAGLAGAHHPPFRYVDKGTMATIGRNSAVAQLGPLSVSGFLGWLIWLGVHLILLVGFRNKLVALLNWGVDYFFYDRPVRLIATAARDEDSSAARPMP